MRAEYKGTDLTTKEKEAVWEILCECDRDFYPRLSLRNSSSQKNLKGNDAGNPEDKPTVYYEEMIKQYFILAYDGDEVVGFMTFKENYECEALKEFGVSLYITTVCVRKARRGQGIMKALYGVMEQDVPAGCGCRRISTRTWSLNDAQIHELTKRGYERLAVLKDDRGPGVDTVYFGMVV